MTTKSKSSALRVKVASKTQKDFDILGELETIHSRIDTLYNHITFLAQCEIGEGDADTALYHISNSVEAEHAALGVVIDRLMRARS